MQTYENATGALWNAGLDSSNTAALQAASAASFLVSPVPGGWKLNGNAATAVDESEEGAHVSRAFLTLQC